MTCFSPLMATPELLGSPNSSRSGNLFWNTGTSSTASSGSIYFVTQIPQISQILAAVAATLRSKINVLSVSSVCDYKNICVVESEASAVVLSELFPESIWMAYATTSHLVPDLFAPLEGRRVTIYPRTDPTMSTFLFFEDLVDQTLRLYDLDLHVDTMLEDHATEDQKERCIDILDFIKEPLSDP